MAGELWGLIIAGGRGTRFWPRSRRALPKQCMSLDGGRTLIQQTVDRIRPLIPPERIVIVTSAEMAPAIREQLPELAVDNVLVEPVGRNTAPAIAWGCMEIAHQGKAPVVAVLPSDHLIDDEPELLAVLASASKAARSTNALVTIGLTPTRPETGFGYLRCGGELGTFGDHAFHRVERFVEKPDEVTAAGYVADGRYLWNAGMFVFTADALRDAFRQFLPRSWALLEELRHSPHRLAELYPQMESTSIDYGIMERSPHVLTVPAQLGWSDVGSWAAIEPHLPPQDGGRGLVGNQVAVDASGNVVHAPGKLVALVGVDGLIVVDTGDALLICPKDRAQDVRRVVVALEAGDLGEFL
ncbi:MAG: mannose-1-phosphate guanylyltransferase [Proteobacteria bacterium]|nr:mannose-1-phosphate guanylyltransferase [Pseudomonadota bacterium]MCP4919149.1 mannose-1-phosphate guanylyltransferase [Pseudomonadota bacterium]